MQEPSLIALSAADSLAVSMIALVSFALGMIVTILVMLARSGPRHHPSTDSQIIEFPSRDRQAPGR